MKQDEDTMEITFSGYVVATDWDDDDNVTALEIISDDDNYYVEKNALWDELVDLSEEDVEITGIVMEERDGTKRIEVTDYDALGEIGYEEEESPGFEGVLDGVNFEVEEDGVLYQDHY